MTIREKIIASETKMLKERLTKLKTINAPVVVLESIEKQISEFEAGFIKIGGDKKLLDVEWEQSSEIKKGRGGKAYVQFNGYINYYPEARYGRFITEDC